VSVTRSMLLCGLDNIQIMHVTITMPFELQCPTVPRHVSTYSAQHAGHSLGARSTR
jgi:hypothetical protein